MSEEVKYFERLDMPVLSIERIKNIVKRNIKNNLKCLKNGIDLERTTFHIVGPSGVGKTFCALQIAKELSEEINVDFQCVIIKSPVISRDDLLCPFPEINDNKSKFKMLYSDFVPSGDNNSFGIFVIDEFERGDSQLKQLLAQILNEHKIHTHDFPRNWWVLSLDNPNDSEYVIDYFEDASVLRRSLHFYTEVSVEDFLNYSIKNNFHSFVIDIIQTHPEYLYDFESQKLGRIFSCPASWHKVSNILIGYQSDDEIFKNIKDIDAQCSGLLNSSMSRIFMDFIKNKNNEIRPKDIFYNYKKTERSKIKNLINNSNNVKIGQIMQSFLTYLSTSKPQVLSEELDNISSFLLDIPADIGATYFTIVKEIKNKDIEAFKYLTKIQMNLMKDDVYRIKFYESMVDMSQRSRE